MGVYNVQKTVKKIWKNLENEQGFQDFKPNWNLVFEDGMEAKITLAKYGHLCEKVHEGGSFLFTIEEGRTTSGKTWYAVRDVLASGGMPGGAPIPQKTGTQTQKSPTPKEDALPGVTIGNIFNNATLLVCAKINSGQTMPDKEAIIADLNYFSEYFEKMARRGTFMF